MNKLKDVFCNKKAFIPFITAGDPDLMTTEQLILAMNNAGADLIEIGIPFSDPVAEGLVIQKASERALAHGTTTDKIFAMVKRVRQKSHVPLAFMTYINPIFTYGVNQFMQNCLDCAISAVIVPDLPFEEKAELQPFCHKYGIALISLIAPSSQARISMIAAEAEGFIYCVSSLGVTGVRTEISTDLQEMIALVKAEQDIPCAVGFGIATPEQASKIAHLADGVIVGSAIIKIIEKYGQDAVQPVTDYVRAMKQACLS